ncbi:hypothetical protein RN96_10510 [Fusobacterium polymorphum]|uniref:Uncharacterized protein n=1 Tax=Fusobacterium nucleatum subsp. polymorphum TaxID=76857 RepID=A0A2B7YHP2_FUSNP|nr:hypothetical protein [Fusobacterium polymorphum]PGH20599.1 hypothetical protein RN96_10510 [Fusobacterium polymorphum]
MRKILVVCFLFLIYSFSFSRVYVKGYYRKDGTYVQSHYRSNPKSRGRKSNYYSSSSSYYDSTSSKENELLNLKENNTNEIVKNNDEILNNDFLIQISDGNIEKIKIYKAIEITDNNGNSRIELKEESLNSIKLLDKTYIIIRNSN